MMIANFMNKKEILARRARATIHIQQRGSRSRRLGRAFPPAMMRWKTSEGVNLRTLRRRRRNRRRRRRNRRRRRRCRHRRSRRRRRRRRSPILES